VLHLPAVTALSSQYIFYPTIGFILLILLFLAGCVGWLVALISALRTDDRVWSAAGHSKLLWVLGIVFLGFLGAILYAGIARPALRRAPLQAG